MTQDWAERDLAYYKNLWSNNPTSGRRHSAERWNLRGEKWGEDLKEDSLFRRQLNSRAADTGDFLRSKGLLQPHHKVVDVGCGPGRFVVDFARTAQQVTGLDISSTMVRLGRDYAREKEITNAAFFALDFTKMSVKEQGWGQHFDLVFSSMTPAVSKGDGLYKLIDMSNAYCFNACPIWGRDSTEKDIRRNLFHLKESPHPLWDPRWFYALFNLLWLEGYLPETTYHTQSGEGFVKVDRPLASFYAGFFTKDPMEREAIEQKIYDYLLTTANPQGEIHQVTQRGYGWILWDVRHKYNRP